MANNCPCDGSGWIVEGYHSDRMNQDYSGARRCVCQSGTEGTVRRILPAAYQEARLSDFATPLKLAADRWLKHPTSGLALIGPTGTGKTYLAAALTRAIAEAKQVVIFTRAADFYSDIRATIDDPT